MKLVNCDMIYEFIISIFLVFSLTLLCGPWCWNSFDLVEIYIHEYNVIPYTAILGLGGGPIIGRQYLSLLEQHKPQMQWEKNSAEHFFLYVDSQNVKHVVFFPSLMSISTRLQEALSWEAGISIWEIGQGLEYFFDIL